MSDNIFYRASRTKLRFQSEQGLLTVEDLWDLPITTTRAKAASLETVGNTLLRRQQELGATSILQGRPSAERITVDLAIEIVREVIRVKQLEAADAERQAQNRSERARLEALIRAKIEQNASVDDLQKQLTALS
jgi:hypothetical protein